MAVVCARQPGEELGALHMLSVAATWNNTAVGDMNLLCAQLHISFLLSVWAWVFEKQLWPLLCESGGLRIAQMVT